MLIKDRIKRKIDALSEAELKQLDQYLRSLKKGKSDAKIRTLRLKGKLDKKSIRKQAYE